MTFCRSGPNRPPLSAYLALSVRLIPTTSPVTQPIRADKDSHLNRSLSPHIQPTCTWPKVTKLLHKPCLELLVDIHVMPGKSHNGIEFAITSIFPDLIYEDTEDYTSKCSML